MLAEILKERMAERDLALRPAAEQIGISHTTLARVLKGQQVDFETLQKLADWAGMSVSTVVNTFDPDEENAVLNAITALIESEPDLKDIFMDAGEMLKAGEISADDLKDIVAYAAYKLQRAKGIHDEASSKGAHRAHRRVSG
jgi:transcriptional regulator with XRE-family HTH domain